MWEVHQILMHQISKFDTSNIMEELKEVMNNEDLLLKTHYNSKEIFLKNPIDNVVKNLGIN